MIDLLLVIVEGAALLVGGAAILAAVLPVPEKARTLLGKARKVLDFLALNLGNAKNEKEPKDE